MFSNWMFFRVTLDMLEMVFAKADPRVVTMYARAAACQYMRHRAVCVPSCVGHDHAFGHLCVSCAGTKRRWWTPNCTGWVTSC